MLGIAAPPAERLEWDRKALAAAEAAQRRARAQAGAASLLNNLGWAAHDARTYGAALAYWQRGLVVREASGTAEQIRIAKWTVARGLRSLGRRDEAEAMQLALAAEMEAAKAEDGFVFEELAELADARGDAEAARRYATRAQALLTKDASFVADEPERLARLAALARPAGAAR